jgi:hypothetical protein
VSRLLSGDRSAEDWQAMSNKKTAKRSPFVGRAFSAVFQTSRGIG